MQSRRRSYAPAFTLIELLVVIAIVAILSVVVVIVLNPTQLLAQSRDADRVADMSSLSSAVGLYSSTVGTSLGSSNVVYVSIPDPSATSTAGDQCQGLNLPTLPSAYTYQCAASSTYRTTNGQGWVGLNFSSMTGGSPFGQLPVDPKNQSSTRLFYTYTTNGVQFEFTAAMESAKYKLGGSNDVIGNDGGTLATVFEKGTQLGLEPLDYGDTSLIGYWPFNEGSGSVANDYSGNNASGTWNGTPAGTSGYYSAGKIGPYAGTFDGSTNYVNGSFVPPTASSTYSICAWVKPVSLVVGGGVFATASSLYLIQIGGGNVWQFNNAYNSSYNAAANTWFYLCGTASGGMDTLYVNGVSVNSATTHAGLSNSFLIGERVDGTKFNGLIDDVRIYNRALSASEIAAMYAGSK